MASAALIHVLKPIVDPVKEQLSYLTLTGTLSSAITVIVSFAIYRLYLHPLAHIPGPILARLTSLWLYYETYKGTEASTLEELHKKYGRVVRIAPNEVDIDDGAALQAIYIENGGFPKSRRYENQKIDDYSTIFSGRDDEQRAKKVKAVASLFSRDAIRSKRSAITDSVGKMADRLEREVQNAAGRPVDVLNVFRAFATDMLTALLFGRAYGGLDEDGEFSGSEYLDANLELSKWFNVPHAAFRLIETMRSNFEANWGAERYKVWKSVAKIDKFVAQVVDEAARAESTKVADTYQARLLEAGVPREEVVAECKSLLLAGTEPVARNLATIVVCLCQDRKKYDALRSTVVPNYPHPAPEILPYLRAVVREGLRLAMAYPTRLPRTVVGPRGLRLAGLPALPAGAGVAANAWCLHRDPAVFLGPLAFKPERWLLPSDEMHLNGFAFGLGPRGCIAEDLAWVEIAHAVEEIVNRDLLKGAAPVKERIEIVQWFTSKVKGGKVEVVWRP